MNKMSSPPPKARRGLTLIEILVATALMMTVMTSVAVLLRGSYTAWQAHENDLERIEAAHATLRHLTRQIRQASEVTAITPSTNLAGSLSLLMPSEDTYVWAHSGGTEQILFGTGSATDLLAENVEELSFVGYEADATTATTTVADIQSIQCIVKVALPVNAGGTRTISCRAWIRSW